MVETRRSSKRMSTPPRLMSLPKRGKGSKKSTTLDAPDWDATKPLTASVQRAQDKCGEHYVRLIQANLEELKRLFQDNEQHEQIKRKFCHYSSRYRRNEKIGWRHFEAWAAWADGEDYWPSSRQCQRSEKMEIKLQPWLSKSFWGSVLFRKTHWWEATKATSIFSVSVNN